VDSRPGYNNAPLALLGQDLLGYATSEYLICHYPRLPMAVLFAAQYAYVGPATLASLRQEWGVDIVAAPGEEVDAGLLQFERMAPGTDLEEMNQMLKIKRKDETEGLSQRKDLAHYRRGMSSRIVYDNQFGDLESNSVKPDESAPSDALSDIEMVVDSPPSDAFIQQTQQSQPTTVEDASASFVRALCGALYLHAGAQAAKDFHTAHILSRKLPMEKLFYFTHPTRDVSRLCAREGFEPPVARLISETGRLSRTPVFIVGVFSGNDKLGEGAGASLDEARIRAAAATLRSWYLYSPPAEDVVLPSEIADGAAGGKKWRPHLVDPGEIIV
jgi:dsRNA-specific ribonuclease